MMRSGKKCETLQETLKRVVLELKKSNIKGNESKATAGKERYLFPAM